MAALVGVESIFDFPLVIASGTFTAVDYLERGELGDEGEGELGDMMPRDFSWVAWEAETTLFEGEKLFGLCSFKELMTMTFLEVY